jgi:hypothetical protein
MLNYWLSFFLYEFIKFVLFGTIIFAILSFEGNPWNLFAGAIFMIINSILLCFIISFFFENDKYAIVIHFGIVCVYTLLLSLPNFAPGSGFPSISSSKKNPSFIYRMNDFSPLMSFIQYAYYLQDYNYAVKYQPVKDLTRFDIYLNWSVSFLILLTIFITFLIILELRLIQKTLFFVFCRTRKIPCETNNKYTEMEKQKVNSKQPLTVRITDLTKIYFNLFKKNTKAVDNVR